ncbi:MAG: VOC family protein [Nitrososphaerota archaeon]|nr:VOC family protein [Nitrososphaerota archaeon]
MNARVTQITIVVKNQAEALEFYTKKVGFEKKTDYTPPGSYRWVTVGPKGQDLEIALFQAGNKDTKGWASHWQPGNLPPIVLRVDDCREAFAELKSRGVEFKQAKPEEYPWGISATFSDPDRNLFSINQLPSNPPWS